MAGLGVANELHVGSEFLWDGLMADTKPFWVDAEVALCLDL